MTMLPKSKKIKRPAVLLKRNCFVRSNTKKRKSIPPIYQKLKHNNNALAVALSEEKAESRNLYTRNIELAAEIQDLVMSGSAKDSVISHILKNSKNLLGTIVQMSEILTDTITLCQKFNGNQSVRSTASSAGRSRDPSQRFSNKSPARGVVKPMVSGHTITKPTINLSRVNLNPQRLPNGNLSIIDESANVSNRSSLGLQMRESHSDSPELTERLPLQDLGNEANNAILNIRTGRYSASPRRLSNRNRRTSTNSRRSSHRLSNHSQIKNACVTLQDVSRLMRNSQSVNLRSLPANDTYNGHLSDSSLRQVSDEPTLTPETSIRNLQNSESDSDSPIRSSIQLNTSNPIVSLPGPSWRPDDSSMEVDLLQELASPDQRQTSTRKVGFRLPPKQKKSKSSSSPSTSNDEFASAVSGSESAGDSESEDDERAINYNQFITRRRGTSIRSTTALESDDPSVNQDLEDLDQVDETEDFTMMMNMRRQIHNRNQQQQRPQPSRFNFEEDMQLTPFKALGRNLNAVQNQQRLEDPDEQTEQINTQVILAAAKQRQPEPKYGPIGKLSPSLHEMTTIVLPRTSEPLLDISLNAAPLPRDPSIAGSKRPRIAKRLETNYRENDPDENQETRKKSTKAMGKKKKDPALAKVVLTKLNSQAEQDRERSISTGRAETTSDSEGSHASRPKRNKAPKNLQEPTLNKKMRRAD